jgi:uncharacterized protein (TIGR02300 family)
MTDPNLGKKRRCVECEAAFYDLNRKPITCPKCGATHQPVVRLKSDGRPPSRTRPAPERPRVAEAVVETAAAGAAVEEDLEAVADAADDDEDEDRDDDEVEDNDESGDDDTVAKPIGDR